MGVGEALEGRAHGFSQLAGAVARYTAVVSKDAGVGAVVGGGPLRALAGLQPVLIVYQHELAALDHAVQQSRYAGAEGGATDAEILHEQVGEHLGRGAEPGVGAGVGRELAYEEYEGTKSRAKLPVLGAVALVSDRLVHLAQQYPGLEHGGTELVVDKVGRHDGPELATSDVLDRLLYDPELGTELPGGASLINSAQDALPEAPPRRQKWVVWDENLAIGAARPDLCAGELAVYLAAVLV